MSAFKPPWDRREILKAIGFAGAALVGGCKQSPTSVLPPCLSGTAGRHFSFDSHIHIFNGTDLQIAGFLTQSVAPEYPQASEIIKILAQPLQDFVWAFSPKAVDELNHLEALERLGNPSNLHLLSIPEPTVKRDQASTAQQYNEFLHQQFRRTAVRQQIAATLRSAKAIGLQTESSEHLLSEEPESPTAARTLAAQIDSDLSLNVFDYLSRYFNYRYANFFEVASQYACGNPTVDTFVALMVDFDQPLSGQSNPKSPISDQIRLMSKICRMAKGRLLALAPYCPLKDVARPGESLANIRQAWQLPGFVGAKMYPPMGYHAYGNAEFGISNGLQIDRALLTFYREATKEDAAVLAHSGPSLCILKGSCETPGPKGWQRALDAAYKQGHKPLRACLGHFGGLLGKSAQSLAWPEEFLGEMTMPSGALLFGDIAYASELLESSSDDMSVRRLIEVLQSHPIGLERMIYGSDWLMLSLEPKWQSYLSRAKAVIDRTEKDANFPGFSRRVFGGNARDWLGLNQLSSLAHRNSQIQGS